VEHDGHDRQLPAEPAQHVADPEAGEGRMLRDRPQIDEV
jgi:hypothetical protein